MGPQLLKRRQPAAGNDSRSRAAYGRQRLVGTLPGYLAVVVSADFFISPPDVVFLAGNQGDGNRLLVGIVCTTSIVPVIPPSCPAIDPGDTHHVRRLVVGTQKQLARVVAGVPEGIVTRICRMEPAVNHASIVVALVGTRIERR